MTRRTHGRTRVAHDARTSARTPRVGRVYDLHALPRPRPLPLPLSPWTRGPSLPRDVYTSRLCVCNTRYATRR